MRDPPVIAQTRIPTLDGLRALAVFFVILAHGAGFTSRLFQIGQVGVLIFFALSGYLITDRLLIENDSARQISLRNFYLRRVFRILPPALVFLFVLWAINPILPTSTAALRAALFFYSNYGDFGLEGTRVSHFWSLSVEEHFYLVWPFLLLACGVRKGWVAAAVLATAVSVWSIVDACFDIVTNFGAGYFHTDHMADALLWGCCLAFYLRARPRIHAKVAAAVAICSLSAMLIFCYGEIHRVTPLLHFLPTLVVGGMVLAPRSALGRFLDSAPMRAIGRLSYSIYIWQQLFLMGVGPKLPVIAAIEAILACAYLSYRFVEKPCIELGKKIVYAPRRIVRA